MIQSDLVAESLQQFYFQLFADELEQYEQLEICNMHDVSSRGVKSYFFASNTCQCHESIRAFFKHFFPATCAVGFMITGYL